MAAADGPEQHAAGNGARRRPAFLLTGMAVGAILALSSPASARLGIDIPRMRETPDYSMRFVAREGDPWRLAKTHMAKCKALGPSRCQVVESMPPGSDYGGNGSVRLLLAAGTAAAFMTELSQADPEAGMTLNRATDAPNRADRELERQLLQAQLDELTSIDTTGSDEVRSVVERKRSDVEAKLGQIARDLAQQAEAAAFDTVSLTYDGPNGSNPSPLNRELGEAGTMFVLGVFVVSGVAILTALYFGILGFAFLWLRKIAAKRGLFKAK
jgi:hypothetical protein